MALVSDMKVTNLTTGTLYLGDLKVLGQAQSEGRRDEAQYLGPAGSSTATVYLPNTTPVLRSARNGDLAVWRNNGLIALEETHTLAPSASVTIAHPFTYGPSVYVLKEVSSTFVDATGTYDLVHNMTTLSPLVFESVTITNTTVATLTFFVRFV